MEEPEAKKKIPYPKGVFFIISALFCERFSAYGQMTILSIYLTDKLQFSENTAKVIFHIFSFVTYVIPIFGAIVADSWLGNFLTIMCFVIIYTIGTVIITLAAIPPLHLPAKELALTALAIIAVGAGMIKPCFVTIGGDQYVLPEQEKQLKSYFSWLYLFTNIGSLVSIFVSPMLRKNVKCFGENSCYSLAFFVLASLMVICTVLFILGRFFYKIKKPKENMVVILSKCICNALKTKSKSSEKRSHWLDYSNEKYGIEMVKGIKCALAVLFLFLPVPVIWALYNQQFSSWTFQARRLNGDIGFFVILPDQTQVLNCIFCIIFVPIFDYGIYPLLNKCNFMTTPLQRMAGGGFLIVISFIVSGGIGLAIEAQDPILPTKGIGQLRIYNNVDCESKLIAEELEKGEISIGKFDFYVKNDLKVQNEMTLDYTLTNCIASGENGTFVVTEEKSTGYMFRGNKLSQFSDDVAKDITAHSKTRVLVNSLADISYEVKNSKGEVKISSISNIEPVMVSLDYGSYTVYLKNETETQDIGKIVIKLGGVYVILVDATNPKAVLLAVTAPNSIHMLWMIPQFLILTMGEIMFSVSGLEFSYSEAPLNMKSVVQAGCLLATAFGNLIVVVIEAIAPFKRDSANLFLYSGILFADMVLFSFMARNYKYVDKTQADNAT